MNNTTITAALRAIKKAQSPNGSWDSFTIDTKRGTQTPTQTTFVTSLILSCLGAVTGTAAIDRATKKVAQEIAARGTRFLLKEKSGAWSWNYWARKNREAAKHPCPDDFDDTSCALAAISLHDTKAKKIIGPKALAAATKLLIAAETKPGGPYLTWIFSGARTSAWHDVDIVVNSNIAYFLKLHGITLQGLTTYAENYVAKDSYESKYYSPLHIIYFISRWYEGPLASTLATRIMQMRTKSGLWGHESGGGKHDPLHTALAVSALINLEAGPQTYGKAVRYLEKLSSWDTIPFYIEGIPGGSAQHAGAQALTAAFCLEALAKNDQRNLKKKSSWISRKKAIHTTDTSDTLHYKIIEKTVRDITSSLPEMASVAKEIIHKMTKKDPGRQITLLPYHCVISMDKSTTSISPALLESLGKANLCGWLAYKVYDDILDNEGNPEHIPLANTCLRIVTKIYSTILPQERLSLFHSLMNDMDNANLWERQHTYFPHNDFLRPEAVLPDFGDYISLAHKSLPHCLGPLSILILTGARGTDLTHMRAFFHHYIIARQLNDDAHDWFSDLERGFVNASATHVLARFQKLHRKNGVKKAVHIESLKGELKMIFWNEVIDGVVDNIRKHIAAAQSSINKIRCLNDTAYFLSLLEPIEQGAKKALTERDATRSFITEYGA